MNHYVYLTTDTERYYIGVRSCECNISQDKYMGSHSDKLYKPTSKRILSVCATRIDAEKTELFYQKLFKVVANPLFVNQVYNFYSDAPRLGCRLSDDTKHLISQSLSGVAHTEERRQRRSNSMKANPSNYFIPSRKGMKDTPNALLQKHLSNRDSKVYIFYKSNKLIYFMRHQNPKLILGISETSVQHLISKKKTKVKQITYKGTLPYCVI